MRSILITGADGFVGKALANHLLADQCCVKQIVRAHSRAKMDNVFGIGNIDQKTDWQDLLDDVDVVVHLAARVHVLQESLADPLNLYREVNVAGTLNLARQAVRSGVRRFVYVSSVKVNGEETHTRPFKADDAPAPQDAYGQSKLEAEQGLFHLARETGLEVVVVRPPLVYGPGVKANFFRLLKLVKRGIPLPLGSVNNLRSLISLENLIDFIVLCADNNAAAGQIFLVSDGEDISTPELIRRIAAIMGESAKLLPVPAGLLYLGGRLLGKSNEVNRLCGSLQLDIEKTREILDWHPSVSLQQGLEKTVAWFEQNNG